MGRRKGGWVGEWMDGCIFNVRRWEDIKGTGACFMAPAHYISISLASVGAPGTAETATLLSCVRFITN
jgi:hypothetical protein